MMFRETKGNRTFLATAFITVASFLFAWGCGGSSHLEENADEQFESIPVRLTIDAGRTSSFDLGLGKDDGGGAEAGFGEGGVRGVSDFLNMSCLIEFGPFTSDTNIQIVNDAGDCTNTSKCLVCNNEWQDPAHSVCLGICEGQVPSNLATATDTIPLTMTFTAEIYSDILAAGSAMIRQDGTITNFEEADITSILVGDHFNLADCDGDPDMEMTIVDPIGIDDLIVGSSWSKGFTLAEIDATPNALGLSECTFDTAIDALVPLTGADIGSVDLTRGPLIVNTKFCDDMLNCDAFGIGGDLYPPDPSSMDSQFIDLDGHSSAFIDEINMDFGVQMDTASVNWHNLLVESSSLAVGQLPPEIESVTVINGAVGNPPFDDGITDDDFIVKIMDAWQYQLQDMAFEIRMDVESIGQLSLTEPELSFFTAGCCLSDDFLLDSESCWDPTVILPGNDPLPPTLGTWAAIYAEGAMDFDTANAALHYEDSGKADDTRQYIRPSKVVELTGGDWQIEAKVSYADGFDSEDIQSPFPPDFLFFTVVDENAVGYSVGFQAYQQPDMSHKQSCIGRDTDALNGAWMPCYDLGTAFMFRLTYSATNQTVTSSYSTDDGETWHDMREGGNAYGLGNLDMTWRAMSGTHYFGIFTSSPDATAINKDNVADIDYVRLMGVDSNTQYSDIDY